MRQRVTIAAGIVFGFVAAFTAPARAAFTSVTIVPVSAVASITTSNVSTATLRIAAVPLPNQAFFGKNVVIPVEATTDPQPLNTTNLKIEMLYQMVDANGAVLNPVTSVPIQFSRDLTKPNTIQGAAILNRSDLVGIERGGQLKYYFHAVQGAGSGVFLGSSGLESSGAGAGASAAPSNAFNTSIINTLDVAVTPAGTVITLPDLSETDHPTAISFAPNVVASPGDLFIRHEDETTFPSNLVGIPPVSVYTFNLNGTSLTREAQLVMSYPADPNGQVTGTHSNGTDLAIYYLQPNGIWRILGVPQIDTTLHTVTGMTTHFSTFALIAGGSVGAADLRPQERIITPNGDGINDTANFSGVDGDVHIFDVRGRRVRTLHGPSPVWDGRDDDGGIVPSGVYIYQYSAQGERVSGVIGVAK